MSPWNTVVVGLGVDGAGDDAVGLWVARRLAAEGLPARETSDATLLLSLFEQRQRVILVDACRAPARVGEVVRLDAAALAGNAALVSSHGMSVPDLLELSRVLYGEDSVRVEIVAIAIDPGRCEPGELSPTVHAAMRAAIALIRKIFADESEPHIDTCCDSTAAIPSSRRDSGRS